MPDALTYEQLLVLVGELSARVAGQDRIIGEQADRIAELERRLGADSSNSSRPRPRMRRGTRCGRSGVRRGPARGGVFPILLTPI